MVRRLFLISIVLQFIGLISAEARATGPAVTAAQEESSLIVSSVFHQEHPADLTSVNRLGGSSFNSRYQRTAPAIANWCYDLILIPAFLDKHDCVYTSPLFLPLVRSLLYPNHYFW